MFFLLAVGFAACKAGHSPREVRCERPPGAKEVPFLVVPVHREANALGLLLPPSAKPDELVRRLESCEAIHVDRNKVRTVGEAGRVRDEASLHALLGCPAQMASGIDFARRDAVLLTANTSLWAISWVVEGANEIVIGTSSATYTGGVNPGRPPSVLLVLPRGDKPIRECNTHQFAEPCPQGLCPP